MELRHGVGRGRVIAAAIPEEKQGGISVGAVHARGRWISAG